MKISITDAILSQFPNAEFTVYGNIYDYMLNDDGSQQGLKWTDKTIPKPTKTNIDAWIALLEVDKNNDWDTLNKKLRKNILFIRSIELGKTNLTVMVNLVSLLYAIACIKERAYLIDTIASLKASITPGFTASEVLEIKKLFDNAGFNSNKIWI